MSKKKLLHVMKAIFLSVWCKNMYFVAFVLFVIVKIWVLIVLSGKSSTHSQLDCTDIKCSTDCKS